MPIRLCILSIAYYQFSEYIVLNELGIVSFVKILDESLLRSSPFE